MATKSEIEWFPRSTAPRDQTVLISVEPTEAHPYLAGKPPTVFPAYVDEFGRLCDSGSWEPDAGFESALFRTVLWARLPDAPRAEGV